MRLAAFALAMMLTACAQPLATLTGAPGGAPDRSAWLALPLAVQAEHARALQVALETRDPAPVAWAAPGASGEVMVLSTSDLSKSPVCRTFSDTLTAGGRTTTVNDAVCWLDGGWTYIAPGPARAVLLAAYAAGERVHVPTRRTTLARVARQTGADADALAMLNPGLPQRIAAGTEILLP